MSRMRLRGTLLGLVLILAFATATAHAASVQKMDLDELCDRAGRIFRGTVVSVTEGTVQAGGAELPTTTYTMRVDEAFKGTYETEKGVQFVKITMLGTLKPHKANGSLQSYSSLPSLPDLRPGEDYLLMTTAPSAIGLSAPVGLGQGCFHISGGAKGETAVNALGNSGLFDGPVAYSTLADLIRNAGQ